MIRRGIILYGPPASGKDTVTNVLTELDPAYTLFRRLKVGPGRSTGYRMTDRAHIEHLQCQGLVVYQNERYGAVYAIDRPELDAMIARGEIPVLHMGQVTGIDAVLAYPADWLTVLLRCSRQTTEHRLAKRGSTDIAARLTAWDETRNDLADNSPHGFGLTIDTDRIVPDEAARTIDTLFIGAAAAGGPQGLGAPGRPRPG